MATETHARLSPSSAERWLVCPGSVAAQAAATEPDIGNLASREGTVAHSLLQTCLVFGFDPQIFLGSFLDGKNMPAVAQHMVDGVQVALDYVSEYLDFYGHDNVEVLPERRVFIGSSIGVTDEECNGTSDIMLQHRDGSKLNVIDYKHGVRPVLAEENPQLFLYTAGAVNELGHKYKQYRNTIIQPRAPRRRAVDEYDYRHGKLTIFLEKAARSAQAALLPDAPRSAGEHCTFCKGKANCNTFRRRVRQIASDEFEAIPDPETIPDDQLDDILAEAKILKDWIAGVEARALSLAKNGYQLRDFQLGWSLRKRLFEDPEAVVAWCRKNNLIVDEYMPRALLTPKKLEDVLKRHKLYPKQERGGDKPESPLSHLISYTVPKPALKPRRDTDAEEDFDAVEDDE